MLEAKALLTNSFSLSLSPVFGLPYVLFTSFGKSLGLKARVYNSALVSQKREQTKTHSAANIQEMAGTGLKLLWERIRVLLGKRLPPNLLRHAKFQQRVRGGQTLAMPLKAGVWNGQTAQPWRGHTALEENQSLDPSTVSGSSIPFTPTLGIWRPLLDSWVPALTCAHTPQPLPTTQSPYAYNF